MAVCQYFLRGQCRFGAQCKNEHPGARGTQFGGTSWTNPNKVTYPFTQETITNDLTPQKDRPLWPLSCYAPSKYEPNLIDGQDESQEELRVKAHVARQGGTMNEYITYETNKLAAADRVFSNAISNIVQVHQQAQNQSPANPNPSTTTPSAFGAPSSSSAFGSAPTTSAFGGGTTAPAFGGSAFGKPGFGQPAFGQSSFGQPTPAPAPATTTSAFGQPTTATTTSAFGQPATTSAFGSTATPSAFGKPSAFGQPAATSAFGQTSQPQSSLIKPATGAFSSFASMGSGAFGSTAPTAAPTGGGGAFSAFSGGNSTPFGGGGTAPTTTPQAGGSVFGQPSFGQSAFGNPTPPAQTSAFGTPATTSTSAFGTPATTTTAFGTPPTTSAFGTPSFGAPSAFGQPAQQPGQATTTTPAGPPPTSAFGGSAFAPVNTAAPTSAFASAGTGNAFGSFSSPSPFAQQSQQQQKPVSAFGAIQPATGGFGGVPPASNGFGQLPQPVQQSQRADNAPNFVGLKSTYKPGSTPYDQALPPNYMEMLPSDVLDAFKAEKFELGKVPEWIPPLQLR